MSLDIRKKNTAFSSGSTWLRENARLNPKKQHCVHNLLSNPQAMIQLPWVSQSLSHLDQKPDY